MINQGDSIATVKTEIADALALVGVEAPTSWSDSHNKINSSATSLGLTGITDGMAGGTARARINAVIAGLETPANVTPPTVTGNAVQGETLTATTGTWTGLAPITYAYQWFNSEADITGATASTYVLTEDDIGLTVGVRVTATNVRGPVGVESDVTAPVTGGGDANIYNFNASTMAQWRSALAQLRAGLTNIIAINWYGDSTIAGQGAGYDGAVLNARVKSPPAQLAAYLTNMIGPTDGGSTIVARSDGVFGTNGVVASSYTYNSFNPDVSIGAGWASNGTESIGRNSFSVTAGAVGLMDVMPHDGAFDRIRHGWLRSGSQNEPRFNVDGAGGFLSGTPISNTNPGYNRTDYSVARGVHTLNVSAPASGAGFVNALEFYDSAAPQIMVRNMSWIGALSTELASITDYKANLTASAAWPAALYIVEAGINNWRTLGLGGLSAYSADLTRMVTTLISRGGSVILISPVASDPINSGTPQSVQQAYVDAMRGVALASGAVFMDFFTRLGPWSSANMQDALHAKAPVYADEGSWVGRTLLAT